MPLIDLSVLGFEDADADFMSSRYLGNLGLGREATAWMDRDNRCVYKLFDLKLDPENRASMGLMLHLNITSPFEAELQQIPATVSHILEKLCVLHEAGACPTEIVGLSLDGKYLIAKQPHCKNYHDLDEDRKVAVADMRGVAPKGSFGGDQLYVFHSGGRDWMLSDLHKGNIRRLENRRPTIIDALIGEISQEQRTALPKLENAVSHARQLASGAEPLSDDPFFGVDDSEL